MTHSHRVKNIHKKNMADDVFPPSSWLEYGIDLTAAGPNDINAVSPNSKREMSIQTLTKL